MKWGYQLNPNGAAPNGAFYGARSRSDDIQLLVLHTGELDPDLTGEDSAAARLSRYMGSQSRGVSWHTTVDSDSVHHELPGEWTAYHVRGWNSKSVGIEMATKHNLWPSLPPDHVEGLIETAARAAARYCHDYDLPARQIESLEEAQQGARGIVAHSTLDPGRRQDPGPEFPWDRFLERVLTYIDAVAIVAIGDRGPAVSKAQRTLHDLGYGHVAGPVDGLAGPMFDEAVRLAERDRGRPATGIWVEGDFAPDPAPAQLRLSGSVGAGGRNLPKDVAAVTDRLGELGFVVADRSLVHSIKLFQAAKDGRETIGGSDGRVDPGHDTLAWLNARNAPRWVHMPAGSDGEGFRSRERLESRDDHGWGTDWLADALRQAASHYKQHYLDRVDGAPLMWSNDASPKRGGHTDDHSGHEAGMQLDIVLPPGGATSTGLTTASSGYDRGAARAILQAFRAATHVHVAYLNDPILIGEGLCARSPGHNDHIHLHIDPPNRVGGGVRPKDRRLQVDWSFIRAQEGFTTKGYVPTRDGRVLGHSGVTIGSGFDLGQHDEVYLVRIEIPSRLIDRLRPYLGRTGEAARDYELAHPLSLSFDDVVLLNDRVKADKAEAVRREYDSKSRVALHTIPAAAQTVIVSVLFQYGSPRPVPKFWARAASQDWHGVIAELRNFGDDYPSRRNREADYLATALPARLSPSLLNGSDQGADRRVTCLHTLSPT